MAALKEPVKMFIVQSLACFDTPQQVVEAVKQDYKIEITRQQVALYDPTKVAGRNLSKKLKDLFERTRTDFRENIEDIAIANKAFRLRELQKMYDDSGKNKRAKQNLLKQVKDEMHGHGEHLLNIQLKQLEIERIKTGDEDDLIEQALAFDPHAFAAAFVPIGVIPSAKGYMFKSDAFALTVQTGGDIKNLTTDTRLDVLYGFATIRGNHAARIGLIR